MTPFAQHFALKEPTRTDFRLSPERDAAAYVEGDAKELTKLVAALEERRVVRVIEGDFGSGKTHLLHAAAQQARKSRAVVFVTLGGLQRRSDFFAVHPLLLAPLLAELRVGLKAAASADIDDALRSKGIMHPDVGFALRHLLVNGMGVETPETRDARSWLTGSRVMSPAKAHAAGYGTLLREALSPDGLVRLYEALADLYTHATGRRVLLVLDEGESFTSVVDTDAQTSIGAALRRMVDPENQSIDFFWGLNLPRTMRATHPMLRSDIASRIGDQLTSLSPLGGLEEARRFVDRLWPHFTSRPGLRPFLLDTDGLGFIHAHLDALRRAFPGPEQTPLAADPSRRDLLHILTMVGQNAVASGMEREALITPAKMRTWFALEAA